MSTPVVAILHYGANERRAIMLEKLGGKKVLREAIDKFYEKQINDPRLMCFFYGVNVEIIKWHQFNLMSIAFTEIPENFDLKELLLIRHQRLFDEGLNETHFDLVAQHFSDTLREMNVDPKLRDEALEVVMPLRDVFAQGVREAQERAESATT
jgi:hemoglobin